MIQSVINDLVFIASWPLGGWAVWQLGISELASGVRAPELSSSILILRDLREGLLSGSLPTRADWQRLESIPRPWGRLLADCLAELRESGLPVVPTLDRMEKLLRELDSSARQARARTSQAWAQAWVCGSFVPLASAALYWLLPGVRELGASWFWATGVALLMSAAAMLWILSMTEDARWAGLPRCKRGQWPALLCFGERFLASLRAGTPPDLAWTRSIPQLALQSQPLVLAWGAELWSSSQRDAVRGVGGWMESWGDELRSHLQRSVMEGRPCTERVESALAAIRLEWGARVERELQLLATRALKPLFLLVAPALFGLLALGLAVSIRSLEAG